jgi:hypothetical protein
MYLRPGSFCHAKAATWELIAINAYIGQKIETWGKWLGIANLGALLVGMGYIFFVLPQTTADKATATLIEGFKRQTEQILDARVKAETAKTNAEAALKTIDEATALLRGVTGQDIQNLKRLIDLLHSDPAVAATIKLGADLTHLKEQLDTAEENLVVRGDEIGCDAEWRDPPTKLTTSFAMCPAKFKLLSGGCSATCLSLTHLESIPTPQAGHANGWQCRHAPQQGEALNSDKRAHRIIRAFAVCQPQL